MKKKPIRKTNVDNVTELMEFGGGAGPLMQAFVVTAIERYAQLCLEKGAAHFDSPMMNGAAWIRCAEAAEKWSLERYPEPTGVAE